MDKMKGKWAGMWRGLRRRREGKGRRRKGRGVGNLHPTVTFGSVGLADMFIIYQAD